MKEKVESGRIKKTDSEILAEIKKQKTTIKEREKKAMAKIERNIIRLIREMYGPDITADALQAKLQINNAEKPHFDENDQRRIQIGRYVEKLTGPDITAEEFADLLTRIERNVKSATGETDENGKIKWNKKPLTESIIREYRQPGSTR